MIHIKKTRVVVAQKQCLLRHALVRRIEKEPDIRVCSVASDMKEMLEMTARYRPHVLVVNISLKSKAGISSLRKLKRKYPEMAIVALSCSSEYENIYIGQALRSGADGYVSSVDSVEDLVQAIHAAREGMPFMSRRTELHHQQSEAEEQILGGLSRREAEVYCLSGCGYVPKQIAEKMVVKLKTVESYLERIRKKMNLANRDALQYSATRFMLDAARRGMDGNDELLMQELLSPSD